MGDVTRRLQIAYLTYDDPTSKKSWSGIKFFMAQALQKHCGDIYYLGPLKSKQRIIARLIHEFYRHILRKNFTFHHSFYVAKTDARLAEQRLAGRTFDLIFTPSNATQIAFLHTSLPIVLYQDATYNLLAEYYPYYSNLAKIARYQGNAIDYMAIHKASLLIYASHWAAQSAIDDYQADPTKVHVVPMAANFEHPPTRELVIQRKRSDRCQLLFVGVDWDRKGGAIAFETLLALETRGINAQLIVVGCVPPKQFAHERMQVIPYLNKNDPQQYAELEQLYMRSDVFLLPTRNEAYGIVFCEANAYGLPVITSDTGGVSEIVKNGENGFLLPREARGDAYADIIARLYQDEQLYSNMVKASRDAYEQRFSWDAWAIAVKQLIDHMLQPQQLQPEQQKQ